MSISFQDIYRSSCVADWMTQDFQGFQLDSRHVTAGQIFIALTKFVAAEKTAQFAQAALDQGALAVISEMNWQLPIIWWCLMCVSAWDTGKNNIYKRDSLYLWHVYLPSRAPMVKPPFHV